MTTPAVPQDFHLICGRDMIQVGVNVTEMNSFMLDPFSGNLAVYYCNDHTESNGTVWYGVETRDGICGNILEINATHIIYSNSLFIYPSSSKPFNIPVDFPFSCAYPLDTDASLDVTLKPFLDLDDGMSGFGPKAQAIMNLYHNSSYTDKYPSGLVTLPVGLPLYVGVTVEERDPRFVAVLEDCYATYTPNPEDTVGYNLIQNQCPVHDQRVSITQSGTSLQARFTALFFLFEHDYREVYFHCSLSLCDQTSSSCVPNCKSRTKRAVSSSELLKHVTIGPIIWGKTPE
ncbi:uncharacterized protein V6R79_024821 [Siganus canaliculatus]